MCDCSGHNIECRTRKSKGKCDLAGTGDYNGDGRDDILWRNDNGTVGDWFGQADGNFASNPTVVTIPNDWHIQSQPYQLI